MMGTVLIDRKEIQMNTVRLTVVKNGDINYSNNSKSSILLNNLIKKILSLIK